MTTAVGSNERQERAADDDGSNKEGDVPILVFCTSDCS
jgi:hypothetical protein